jgi:hypothetical protein
MNGQPSSVPRTPIGANINKASDIVVDLASEVAFDYETVINNFSNSVQIGIAQLSHFWVTGHISLNRYAVSQSVPDSINTGECNLYPFVIWNIDVCNTCHVLSLPLFVPRVCANNPQHPAALDLSAFITPGFD